MSTTEAEDRTREAAARDLLEVFEARGGAWYGGERVTQLEHGLQSAALAEAAGDPDELVLAALLHDIGHLLAAREDDDADDHHERCGAVALRRVFGLKVAEPVRLHVDAKRFLVATDASYKAQLSPESCRSLKLQGGAMSVEECAAFLAKEHAELALRLRRYDERAKVPGLATPSLEHYRPLALRWALDRS